MRVATLPVEFESAQTIEVASQPACAALRSRCTDRGRVGRDRPVVDRDRAARVQVNVPVPPTITFLTIRPPCFVFVKTHLTFAGRDVERCRSRARVAGRVRVVADDRRQRPAGLSRLGDGIRAGDTLDDVCPSPSVASISPVKLNVCESPSGSVCFSIVIVPSLVFVNVQVTVSPASTLNVAVRVPADGRVARPDDRGQVPPAAAA